MVIHLIDFLVLSKLLSPENFLRGTIFKDFSGIQFKGSLTSIVISTDFKT